MIRRHPRIDLTKLIVYVDMDGVLSDFHSVYTGLSFSSVSPVTPTVPSLPESFWTNLPLLPHAHDLISYLSNLLPKPNNQLFILSSPSPSQASFSGKFQWINEHFPNLTRNLILSPRKYFLASPDSVLIDNYQPNIAKFIAHNGKAFLFPASDNARANLVSKALPLLKEFMVSTYTPTSPPSRSLVLNIKSSKSNVR